MPHTFVVTKLLAEIVGRPIVASVSRLKGGCSQDWLPHEQVKRQVKG